LFREKQKELLEAVGEPESNRRRADWENSRERVLQLLEYPKTSYQGLRERYHYIGKELLIEKEKMKRIRKPIERLFRLREGLKRAQEKRPLLEGEKETFAESRQGTPNISFRRNRIAAGSI
jgi:predicted RNA-binding protein with EMAP domain